VKRCFAPCFKSKVKTKPASNLVQKAPLTLLQSKCSRKL